MKRLVSTLVFQLILLLLLPVFGAENRSPGMTAKLSELIYRVEASSLHLNPYWHILLHYESNWPGWESEVDDPRFFLAADGKTNPAAELRQTLIAFMQPATGNEHARCRFPARFAWLQQKLGFRTDRMPFPACRHYHDWLKKINAGSITLVFPNYFINTPASMFGHTLLRINSADPERPALLSWAVNYAALVDYEHTNVLAYGFKGVFGGFRGVFTVSPYYLSVRAYNDMEERDIWEYDLAFTPGEVRRLMRHLWELKPVYFDYYFFRENCSYHLLSLLEAARPGLFLRKKHLLWTLPVDTVTDLTSQPGLVIRKRYRPSRWSRFQQMLGEMTEAEKKLALSILRSGSLSFTSRWQQLSKVSRCRILDLLAEGYALQQTPESGSMQERVLALRAELRTVLPENRQPPAGASPDTGHGTVMASLSSGYSDFGGAFSGVSLRLSLHGLLDRETGYIPNNGVELLHARFRRYEGESLDLHALTLARFFSLNARGALNSGLSWKLDTGWYPGYYPGCDECRMFLFNPGGGVGFSAPGGIVYMMGEFRYSNGDGLQPAGHAAIGLSAGYVSRWVGNWRGMVEGAASYPGYSGELPDLRQQFGLSWTPFRNHAFRLDWRRDNDMAEQRLSYRFFF